MREGTLHRLCILPGVLCFGIEAETAKWVEEMESHPTPTGCNTNVQQHREPSLSTLVASVQCATKSLLLVSTALFAFRLNDCRGVIFRPSEFEHCSRYSSIVFKKIMIPRARSRATFRTILVRVETQWGGWGSQKKLVERLLCRDSCEGKQAAADARLFYVPFLRNCLFKGIRVCSMLA